MELQRRHTRFGAPRGATPDSDEYGSNETASTPASPGDEPPKKLRKRPWGGQVDETSRKSRQTSLSTIRALDEERHRSAIGRNDKLTPSESLTMLFTLRLGDPVIIASRKDGTFVAVKKSSSRNAIRKLNMLENINHGTFIKFLHCITAEDAHYFVFEHDLPGQIGRLSVSLSNLVTSPTYVTESQLKTILRPILQGIEYLASMGLEHGSIECSNILLGTDGSVRIARQECCRKLISNRNSKKDIKGVGYIAMALMNKQEVYKGSMGVHNTKSWPLEGAASQFILCAESATSIDELKKQPLIAEETGKGRALDSKELEIAERVSMKAFVYLSEISTYRGYSTKVDEKDIDDNYIDDKYIDSE